MPHRPRGLVPKLPARQQYHQFPKGARLRQRPCREYFKRLVNADEHPARCLPQTQNNLDSGARRGASSRRLGMGIKPSRCASFLAALRARRTASAFSRVLRSDGFSYALRRLISRKTPSRCIFFLRALRACSTLLSRTNTCKMFPIVVVHGNHCPEGFASYKYPGPAFEGFENG